MAWRFHSRAQVNPDAPRAFGQCGRCGFTFNLDTLRWQHDYAGTSVINRRILVCGGCEDEKQPQKRVILIPADPPPVMNARPVRYAVDEAGSVPANPGALYPAPTYEVPVAPALQSARLNHSKPGNSQYLVMGL